MIKSESNNQRKNVSLNENNKFIILNKNPKKNPTTLKSK